jgi:ethanolamine ammonia-lyase large subunit
MGVAAADQASRLHAKSLLAATKISDLNTHSLFDDAQYTLIRNTTKVDPSVEGMTLGQLKTFVLDASEEQIKQKMPSVTSDVLACLVKIMTNDELITVGSKVFNPLPGSNIGSKGYMSARIQPNSPTDHPDDIRWQVFNGWSYAVGDLVLGTNPVSSNLESVAGIEQTLHEILKVFGLENVMPNCVLSHIDIQARAEELYPGTTGIWFQSLAGTVNANKTFDVTIDKMFDHVSKRKGKYGLYAETGQGADATNGHGEGFDMVVHESRKYGFLRALKQKMTAEKDPVSAPWVFVNDVAGFIGPEVFRTKEQLVRCCLEDIVMGKLHGLTIGLDVCTTLHMDVHLDDLAWCIDQIMPANPGYLMALPTKNDPMLSYLTTAFNDHVRVREKFGYKINDAMWNFFKKIGIIDKNNRPTEHFGDPIWVYYQYCKAKGDSRTKEEIYAEGRQRITDVNNRGVPIAEGYGDQIWDLPKDLDARVHALYEDAKTCIWAEFSKDFIASIPTAVPLFTISKDRKDYIYHPESGEKLSPSSIQKLDVIRRNWGISVPDVQIIISDGLNVNAIMDDNHLFPFLQEIRVLFGKQRLQVSDTKMVITNGRVRAGYACGELLFGKLSDPKSTKGILHIIGERPGTEHRNYSVYITVAQSGVWGHKGVVDHNITRVVSGISDTAMDPKLAAAEVNAIFGDLLRSAI